MAMFPTCRGEPLDCLNPLRPRHYFLLAYWVYFRPTAVKCYLYQAAPNLYRSGPGLGVARALRVPAYRNILLMVPGTTLLFSLLAGLPVALASNWLNSTSLDPLEWVRSVAAIAILVSALGILISLAIGMAIGVASGIAGGTVDIIAFVVTLGVVVGVSRYVEIGVVIGLLGGTAGVVGFSVGGLVAGGLAGGVGFVVTFALAFGLTIGRALDTTFGVAFAAACTAGALRIIFYPFQFGWALRRALPQGGHPLEWDELVVLPLPRTRQMLVRHLQGDEFDGLSVLADIARNPFQRWAAQRVLHAYLHHQTTGLQLIYTLLTHPRFDTYVMAPLLEEQWDRIPSVRKLLLGELNGQWVDCSSEQLSRLAERLVWSLTLLGRDRRKTPLTRFAGMLYELLDQGTIDAEQFDLSAYAEMFADLVDYPDGVEIVRSFETMGAFLAYREVEALARAGADLSWLEALPEPWLRPTVLEGLRRLGQVGAEVQVYRESTGRVNKLAALARATNALDELDEYVAAEVMVPERYILSQIIRQWRRLVSEAGGQVGRTEEVGPVRNPYVAGNPVGGDLFVGREDILRRLEELWASEGQCPSVLLYGHRRMGKSSILHNLGGRFGARTTVVDFNMQRAGLVDSTGELLYNLALALYDAQTLGVLDVEDLAEPDEERFANHNPYMIFDRFLKQLDQVRDAHRFIVTVDEFELIEALIAEGKLELRLLDFWRGLIQTYPWLVVAFAGLHTLEEMRRDYWNPLFGSVTAIPVSFLGRQAAWRLITQPTPDFALDYDAEAVDSIYALTHGQPYLTQLIGHGLVTRFNRQTFEEGVERERRFTSADVEAIIGAPEFFRDGDAYFTGVWRQAETSQPPGQTVVLHVLTRSETGMPVDTVAAEARLAPTEVAAALDTLARHDVVVAEDGRWRFAVELMRRWAAQTI